MFLGIDLVAGYLLIFATKFCVYFLFPLSVGRRGPFGYFGCLFILINV